MDTLVGLSLMAGSVMFAVYYTTWVMILPFVDEDSFLQHFFPPKVFAVATPLIIGVIGLIVIGIFASVKMSRKRDSPKLKAS